MAAKLQITLNALEDQLDRFGLQRAYENADDLFQNAEITEIDTVLAAWITLLRNPDRPDGLYHLSSFNGHKAWITRMIVSKFERIFVNY